MPDIANSPVLSLPPKTADDILHGLILAGMIAASIFIKNPDSKQKAAQIEAVITNMLLPQVGTFGEPSPAAQPTNLQVPSPLQAQRGFVG